MFKLIFKRENDKKDCEIINLNIEFGVLGEYYFDTEINGSYFKFFKESYIPRFIENI